MGADYFFAENDGETSTNSLRIFGQAQRLLTERFYIGAAASFLNDDVADINYRVDVASIFGYHLIKNDRTTLSFEAGPGYAFEDQGGVTDNFATLRVGERFEHQLSGRSKLWQSAFVTPQIDDFNNYFLIAEVGIDTLLSDNWSVRTSVRYLFDNTPAEGRESEDLTLTMGLAYALGGFPEAAAAGRATLKADRAPASVAPLGWVTTASLGINVAQGNADNITVSLGFDSAYRTATDEFFFNALYAFGETDGERAADALRLGSRYNRLLSDRFYVGGQLDGLRDEVAELEYRIMATAIAGYYVVKNDKMTLAFEAGPGVTFEQSGGEQDSYLSLRAAERFSWAIGARTSFNQAAVIDLDPSDFDNYILTVTAALDTDITDAITWRLAANYVYDNQPVGDLENADTTLTSGIAVKF